MFMLLNVNTPVPELTMNLTSIACEPLTVTKALEPSTDIMPEPWPPDAILNCRSELVLIVPPTCIAPLTVAAAVPIVTLADQLTKYVPETGVSVKLPLMPELYAVAVTLRVPVAPTELLTKFCQVAAVADVAIKNCPDEGAADENTFTIAPVFVVKPYALCASDAKPAVPFVIMSDIVETVCVPV